MGRTGKIYTKTGDRGETSLLGGTRVPKSHERVEAYGTIDELNSFLGLLRDHLPDEPTKNLILRIQENLFIAEAWVASDPGLPPKDLPELKEEETEFLEHAIDTMNEELPPLSNFILPGGHPAVSSCHIARTVCRRAERALIRVPSAAPSDAKIIQYLNRLSDYLFVLARKAAKDAGVDEKRWLPGK